MTAPESRTGPASILVEELTIHRGRTVAVDAIDLGIDPGITVLAGPNGAGKSTLLAAMATLLAPRSGRLVVAGHDLSTRSGRRGARSRVGYLAQRARFPDRWTASEAVRYAAWLHRLRGSEADEATDTILADLDLMPHAGTPLRKLSGGTHQRVMLAQAAVHRPPVLLLDEPTVGIDAEHRVDLRRLIRSLATDRTVLVTTHLTEDVELLAERVVALAHGRVTYDGTPGDLASSGRDADHDERPIERALRRLVGPEHS